MVNQGLLPSTAAAPVNPGPAMPNQAAPVDPGPVGSAPVMPNQAAPVDPGPAMPGQVAPVNPAPIGPVSSAPISTPQPQRDYQSNPLNEKDKENLTNFQIMVTKVVHNPQIRGKIIERIKGKEHPYAEIADASLVIMQRVEQEGIRNKQPWDDAVKLLGGMIIVEQVIEVAQASGRVPTSIPHQDYRIIYGEAIQKYYKRKIASGEITKSQAAQDAHMLAQQQAQMKGEDTTGINQRLNATSKLQQQGITAPAKAALPGAQLKAPEPAANPMRPVTTMKEVLASGQGGLLNE